MEKDLPPGMRLELAGEYKEQVKSFKQQTVVMAISVIAIFLALVIQFKHAIKPLIVFAAIPFGMAGSLAALYIMGAPFGFMAFLGIASLVGVIVSHIIVLFDFIEESHAAGAPLRRGAARRRNCPAAAGADHGGSHRDRAVPLASHGGPLWEPLCYAQIGGLTLSTMITLVLVPVVYAIFVLDLKWVKWERKSTGTAANTNGGRMTPMPSLQAVPSVETALVIDLAACGRDHAAAGRRESSQSRRTDSRRAARAPRLLRNHRSVCAGRRRPHRSISVRPAPAHGAREALLAAGIPARIAAAVIDAYQRLGEGTPVAVRSSATAEDLPHASFAGQQDTYLNVIGAEGVLDAVQRCWASLWTDRAVVYRSTNGIDHHAVRLAVVVQRMVDAEIAGVLFTANPVTGRRRQAVIDASPGLGEAVVSGAVNPDHFVVDTGTGDIVERRLGDKRFEVRSSGRRRHAPH